MDTSLLALWGAVLSTILAFVKLWEVWSSRFRMNVSHNFTSCPHQGSAIFLRNLSGRPVIVEYWELFYGSGIWPFRKTSDIASSGPDTKDQRIDSHSSKSLVFVGPDHFDWGVDALKGRKIYIRLHIAGRRPTTKKVFG